MRLMFGTCSIKIIVFMFFFCTVISAKDIKPEWVIHRPVNAEYFIGIGSAQKKNHETDYQKIAKNYALSDLSSEITVNISSELVSNLSEKSGIIAEDVKSHISSTTRSNLEKYEQVAIWENFDEYWIYYRMSKRDYFQRIEARKNKVVGLARDLYLAAIRRIDEQNIASAFSYLLQAFTELEEYIGEPIEFSVNGKATFLQNELFSSMQNIFNSLEIQPPSGGVSYKTGRSNTTPLQVHVFFTGRDGVKKKQQGFPVKFSFLKGTGILTEHSVTDNNGLAFSHISAITAPDKLQMIKVQPDIAPSRQDTLAPIAFGMIRKMAMPEAKCVVNVVGMSVFIKSEEYLFDNKISATHIEPQLKNSLTAYGCVFTNDPSKADLSIEMTSYCRKGAEIADYNLFSAMVDVTVSITDLSSGKEIYKDVISNIKDVDTNYDNAGNKALVKAGKKIAEMTPAIIKNIQN